MQPSKEKRHHGHAPRDPTQNDGSNSVARTKNGDDDGSNLDARTTVANDDEKRGSPPLYPFCDGSYVWG